MAAVIIYCILAYLVLLDRLNKSSSVVSRVDNDRIAVRQTQVQEQRIPVGMTKRKFGDIYLRAWRATERDGRVTAIEFKQQICPKQHFLNIHNPSVTQLPIICLWYLVHTLSHINDIYVFTPVGRIRQGLVFFCLP